MGTPMNEAELEVEVRRVEDLITTVTTTPQPSYSVDGVRYDHAGYLKVLMALRDSLYNRLQSLPFAAESVIEFVDE